MKKWGLSFGVFLCTIILLGTSTYTSQIPKRNTPDYKISFFAYDCFNEEDKNGKKSGYGYDMMQYASNYLQCTFSYVGYDKSAAECEEMLRNGKLDVYTAAKITPERKKEFCFSKHPSITATTYITTKVGNKQIIAGDYDTYDGMKVGLLKRHTYNGKFEDFAKSKGFSCKISYYDTPGQLTSALINGKVDALVNSYIGIPEDEQVIETLEETPYYLMARKEDKELIENIDRAIDKMNIQIPNWRTELFNEYYGTPGKNKRYTKSEQELLQKMQEEQITIRAVMNPDQNPYSWYQNGKATGISADIFKETAKKLGLNYEILTVEDQKEYQETINSGNVDVLINVDHSLENYKLTSSYLSTTMSVVHRSGFSGKVRTLAVLEDDPSIRGIVDANWPNAKVMVLDNTEQCKQEVLNGTADGMLLMTYVAQRMAQDDVRNRLRVEIVPSVSIDLCMGVNTKDDVRFLNLWNKTLMKVSDEMSAKILQSYLERTVSPTLIGYFYAHPSMFFILLSSFFLTILFITLYILQSKGKQRLERVSEDLAIALEEANEANELKQNFFSKMSHDIRTPLNVVLGMTQVAQKYKYDTEKLENALEHISSEGNYLLLLINSILDVNQLEHGHIELLKQPFDIISCVQQNIEILRPLVDKKEQDLKVFMNLDQEHSVVIGDSNRYSQILINILSNAIKYTPQHGSIEVTLNITKEQTYRFSCKDNGIGMTKEFIEHICDDYARAEDSRISKAEGTGLGMSVVKGFTELMNGSLEIDSELGKGSTFSIEIPFKEAEKEESNAVLNVDAVETEEIFCNQKVLLIEDNELNAEIAIELLQMIGLTVDWEENGKLGLERFLASKPNSYFAIFMDMQMPVMDGIEATKNIRNSNRSDRDIPIFAMTANTFANDRKKCQEAGMTGHIAKPIHLKEIKRALKKVMHA